MAARVAGVVGVRAADEIITALSLPTAARLDLRVARKALLDSCDFVAADKRLLTEALQEITWVAALKPSTCGLRAVDDDRRLIEEVQVLRLRLKAGRHPPRVVALCHRVVPYPVVLVIEAGASTSVSLANKRTADGTATGLVLDGVPVTIEAAAAPWKSAWLASLTMAHSGAADLGALYAAWWCSLVGAARAQRVAVFAVPRDAAAAATVLAELEALTDVQRELKKLQLAMKRETQMALRVELNAAIHAATTDLDDVQRRLLEMH